MPERATSVERQQDNPFRVIPHYDRLDTVVGRLLEAQLEGTFPYSLDSARLPQDERHMPPSLPRGGKEHANFLWAVCYWMRGGIKSNTAVMKLSGLYDVHPEYFEPSIAQYLNSEDLADALTTTGLPFKVSEIKKSWIENASRMQEKFGGDPRNIFNGITTYSEVLQRVKNDKRGNGFEGFQEKMASMITYYLMDAGLVPYFDFPLPVDFHVLRVSAATNIISFENLPSDGDIYSEQTLDTLRTMYHDYSVRHSISQLDVCNAVWSLSSAICGIQPGNRMAKIGGEARSTILEPQPVDYGRPEQVRRYARSCLMCPIERLCGSNYPSANYYILGKMIGSERQRPPTNDPDALFSLRDLNP